MNGSPATSARSGLQQRRRFVGVVAAYWLVVAAPADALGQPVTAVRDDAPRQGVAASGVSPLSAARTREQRLTLLAGLSDSQLRELLLRELDAREPATGRAKAEAVPTAVQSLVANIRQNLADILQQSGDLPIVIPFAITRLADGDDSTRLFSILVSIALMLLAGAATEWLFRRATWAARQKCENGRDTSGRLIPRLLLDLLGLALFALTSAAAFAFIYYGLRYGRSETSLVFAMVFLAAVMIVRLTSLLARLLLAPNTRSLRLVAVSDASARNLQRWVIVIAALTSFGFLGCALLQLFGLVAPLYELLLMIVGFVITGALVAMIWHSRRSVAALIRGPDAPRASQSAQIFADIWHLLASGYVIALYGGITLARLAGYEPGIGVWAGSLLVVIGVPLTDTAVRHGLGRFLSGYSETHASGEGAREYQAIMSRALRLVIVAAAALALASLWGIDLFSTAQSHVGANVTRAALDIALTLMVAHVGWELTKTAIDRRLAMEGAATSGKNGGGEASRLRTLLPLFRRFLQITIVVMVLMIVLSSLGVNVGPLIAGAGVVGLAIGFGAQTLVRDIVSGMFFLLDDAFRLSEYVDIGSVKGKVEAIHVRSLVLRHHRGPLHTVPFGEIKRLTNFSRDWVIMKFEFRVPYDTNIDKVKKLFKKIGADLLQHEQFGAYFIEPFKSQGVTSMDDSAMIIRAKFKAIPERQYEIRKEVYARVQQAFHENGIKFANRRVTVDLPPGIDASTPQGRAIADAAAAAAVAQPAGET